jgi:hypothetical protein
MGLLKRLASSLWGNVVIFEVCASLPLFLVFLFTNYAQWTAVWTMYAAFLCAVGGVVSGALFWLVATRPLLQRRQGPSVPPPNNRWRGP